MGIYMGLWNDGGFFSNVKGHVFKWWQLVIMPVLRINNNGSKVQYTQQQPIQQPVQQPVEPFQTVPEPQLAKENGSNEKIDVVDKVHSVEKSEVEVHSKQSFSDTDDAMGVLRRINEEKEEKRRREIENARQKVSEEARIAAIMNANKVDVNAFIEAGKVAKEEIANKRAEEQAQEERRRAQEILDRLNREAEEDEAKKRAEIEAAKEEARKQFG